MIPPTPLNYSAFDFNAIKRKCFRVLRNPFANGRFRNESEPLKNTNDAEENAFRPNTANKRVQIGVGVEEMRSCAAL